MKLTLRKISGAKAKVLFPGVNLRRIAMKPLRQSAGVGAYHPPSMIEIVKEQPVGDLSTRKDYKTRKVDTEPTLNAYRGIVNIYELLERPTPGVAKKAKKKKGEIRKEELEAAAAVPAAPPAVPPAAPAAAPRTKTVKKKRDKVKATPPPGPEATPKNADEILQWMRRTFPGRVIPIFISDNVWNSKYKHLSPQEAMKEAQTKMVFYRRKSRGAPIEFGVLG